jgi:hypothetical protein
LLKSAGCGLNVGHVSSEVRITRISEQCDRVGFREKLMQQLHTFRPRNTERNARTREVAVGSTETFDKTHLDRVGADQEYDGDRFGRCLCSKCRREVECRNHGDIMGHQFSRKGRQLIVITICPAAFDTYVSPFHKVGFPQSSVPGIALED